MRQILMMIAVVVGQSVLAADKKPLTREESAKKIEAAIRRAAKKPTGELIKADLEKVTVLRLFNKQLTGLKGAHFLKESGVDQDLYSHMVPNINKLTNLEGLEKLTQLRALYLSGYQLTSVKGLEKLTQLEELYINGNQLTDAKGLEKLNQLKILGLADNKLTDVSGLEKLNRLKELDLTYNPVLTKAQIDQLQKALPKCEIRTR